MREIDAAEITKAVSQLCIKANLQLPPDVEDALIDAVKKEDFPSAADTLRLLQKNLELAAARNIPICQDTGAACIFAEIGQDLHIKGDFEEAVNEGVRKGYKDGFLRKSIVQDPVRRGNTGDNTPAFITTHLVKGDKIKLTILPKGFGSENMSRVAMLKPSDGLEGIKAFVLETVKLAGPNPCPPVVLGIGIGGTFDKVTYLAKKALVRPICQKNADPFYAELEGELLTEINKLGTGPQGFGGRTTCLGVAIEVMPTHVAGMPVAVNVSCHVTRRASVVL
ncbi:MAG: fumarate hydratase [Treponemataceae bacterium]|nr:fumarate hydratase [Treponemataceae bacterium]